MKHFLCRVFFVIVSDIMKEEKILVIVKPDAIVRGLIGEVFTIKLYNNDLLQSRK